MHASLSLSLSLSLSSDHERSWREEWEDSAVRAKVIGTQGDRGRVGLVKEIE